MLIRQLFYHLAYACSPFWLVVFQMESIFFCLGWHGKTVLLPTPSWVVGITVAHQHAVLWEYFWSMFFSWKLQQCFISGPNMVESFVSYFSGTTDQWNKNCPASEWSAVSIVTPVLWLWPVSCCTGWISCPALLNTVLLFPVTFWRTLLLKNNCSLHDQLLLDEMITSYRIQVYLTIKPLENR
jgi:hypothetical protein